MVKEILGGILLCAAVMNFISSVMYTFVETTPGHPFWFSRSALSVIAIGFLYLGECINGNSTKTNLS